MELPKKKPTAKKTVKKPANSELTEGLIAKLPGDALRNIALNMNYEDIIHWCQTAKRFNDLICNNEPFWANMLKQDFPDKYTTENAKDAYILAYANLLDEKAEDYNSFAYIEENDPRFKETLDNLDRIEKEMRTLKEEERQYRKELKAIERKYAKKGEAVKKQAAAIRKQLREKLPPEPERTYREFETPTIERFTADLNSLDDNNITSIRELRKILPLQWKNIELNPGNLLGFRSPGRRIGKEIPPILIYIYEMSDGLHFNWWSREIAKDVLQHYFEPSINELYDLPFNI
jgi:hypothetical protein